MPAVDLKDMMFHNRCISKNAPIEIIIIGCGGTGSMFIRDAIRIAKVYNDSLPTKKSYRPEPRITDIILIDGDIVETKNLVRQNFIPCDIGCYKSEVLAERYGAAFDMPIKAVTHYMEDPNELFNLAFKRRSPYESDRMGTKLIFSFVDNVKTRLMLSNFMMGYYDEYIYNIHSSDTGKHILSNADIVMIDSGNSKYAGQVCISAVRSNYAPLNFYIPSVAEQNPDLLDPANWDKFASEASCEEAADSDPQTISANATAANICMNIFHQLLFEGAIHYQKVMFNAQDNNATIEVIKDKPEGPSIAKIVY